MEQSDSKRKPIDTNQLTESTQKNMTTRITSGVVLAVICFPCAFLGGWFYFTLIFFVAIFAIYEFIKSTDVDKKPFALYVIIFLLTLCLIYWMPIKNNLVYFQDHNETWAPNVIETGFSSLYISTLAIIICLGVMFLITIFDRKFSVENVCYYFTMMVVVAMGIQSLYFLRYIPLSSEFESLSYFNEPVYQYGISAMLLMYMLTGSIGNDIGAYFIGVFFGKHKLNERISPHKTWEGFAGGVVFSIILSLALAFICDSFGYPVLKGYIDIEHWYWVLLLSSVMPLVSVLGDLAFSAIKRHYQIKDFGIIIPGHGGILDRLDSIIFCSIGLVSFLVIIMNNWNFKL